MRPTLLAVREDDGSQNASLPARAREPWRLKRACSERPLHPAVLRLECAASGDVTFKRLPVGGAGVLSAPVDACVLRGRIRGEGVADVALTHAPLVPVHH